MYKIFHGFHLVEAYQDLKKAKRLAKNQTVARCIKLTVAITLSLILWLLPIDTFGIEGLTVIEQRLISIFIFATLYNPQIEMFARFKMKSSFHKTKRII